MDIVNILFCGIGGQGILTSSRVLALAAMHAGLDVKVSEVHGMSQRGGNVDTHVRIGRDVPSSLIPRGAAHVLIAFEKLEALRYLDYLRPDGVAIVCPLEIPPLSLSLKKDSAYVPNIDGHLAQRAPLLLMVEADRMAREVGDSRMVNVILLGALASQFPAIGREHWTAAIRDRFGEARADACLRAFEKGVESVAVNPRA
mgnify:CR=1 FL=1